VAPAKVLETFGTPGWVFKTLPAPLQATGRLVNDIGAKTRALPD